MKYKLKSNSAKTWFDALTTDHSNFDIDTLDYLLEADNIINEDKIILKDYFNTFKA